MDLTSFWSNMETIFILLNILVGIVWIYRSYLWTNYNPSRFRPLNYEIGLLLNSIVLAFETWSFVMFFFLFGVSGYWFIFYKM